MDNHETDQVNQPEKDENNKPSVDPWTEIMFGKRPVADSEPKESDTEENSKELKSSDEKEDSDDKQPPPFSWI
ncbi:hypothetical protein CR194_06655 [Salipaludibacillus keqinensis]|uniref:Uncharacterized protein n=1 Tax=Salipaludibacillus keqinensis TaxID=2045207 RepID=A0A323TJN3_9BACI|nr:hypothetical protein [Salipaludibacillus keqinensis]PYZ95191.1 hypothetical protein CR194_06655 [Salipaludibacillus keqinensis]